MPIHKRPVLDFTPTEFSTAKDKTKFYDHFIRFMEKDCPITLFPDWFYTRLSMTFGHIAHYNRLGFYSVWFETDEKKLDFINNALRHGCYGSPQFTYCDVEREIQKWLVFSGLASTLAARIAVATEVRERGQFARLQEKYGST